MNIAHSILIKFVDGTTKSFKGDAAYSFKVMPEGFFFVETLATKKENKIGTILKSAEVRNERFWFPRERIADVQVITHKTISDPDEVKKYEAFMKHNIDMFFTEVSYTAPPNEETIKGIEAEIEAEKKQ